MTLKNIAIGMTLGLSLWSQSPRVSLAEERTAIDGEGLIPVQASNQKILEEQLGIQILSLRLTSAGSRLGLRFRVVGAEKAAPLFDRDRPHMIHQASGVKLCVMANDAPPATRPQPEGIYSILFGNASFKVKHGDQVTILVGDYRVKDIVVFASVEPAAF